MPIGNVITPNRKLRKKKTYLLIVLILILLTAFIASVSTLVLYLKNPQSLTFIESNTEKVTQTSNNNQYSKFDDFKCGDESEYENILILSKDTDAYAKVDFYKEILDPADLLGKISSTETLYTELIMWDNPDADSLVYSGRALVCIKGQNKLATIQFTTDNSKFKYPVRYKDPEKRIKNVLIHAFYMVPADATPRTDWMSKIKSNLENIKLAQNRIFDNQSNIDYMIYPEVVTNKDLTKNFLTQVAKGIVTKDQNDQTALRPVDFLDNNIYSDANLTTHPDFNTKNVVSKTYDQISSIVYFEVGGDSKTSNKGYESGYAFTNSALNNGNYFGIIGTNLSRDISLESAAYHEFMHTLGLPDEYAYTDGSTQRVPTHLFKSKTQAADTLMQNPAALNLLNTYIDDQERIMMGVKD